LSLKPVLDEAITGIQYQCSAQFFELGLVLLSVVLAEGEEAVLVEEEHVRTSGCDDTVLHSGVALLARHIVLNAREVDTELDGLRVRYRDDGFCLCDSFHSSTIAPLESDVKSLEDFDPNNLSVMVYVHEDVSASEVYDLRYCGVFVTEVVGVDFLIE